MALQAAEEAEGRKNLETTLSSCIQEGLERFGTDIPPVVYFYIRQNYNLSIARAVKNPSIIDQAIDGIFDVCSSAVKEGIISDICGKFSIQGKCKTIEEAFKEALAAFDSS